MNGLLSALVLLCGLDYSGANYKACVKNTTDCYNKSSKKMTKIEADKPLTKAQKDVFYKCYSTGHVAEAPKLKRK